MQVGCGGARFCVTNYVNGSSLDTLLQHLQRGSCRAETICLFSYFKFSFYLPHIRGWLGEENLARSNAEDGL